MSTVQNSRQTTVVKHLAAEIERYKRCRTDPQFEQAAGNALAQILELQNLLPSGGGIDSGCTIDIEASNAHKIVIQTAYQHMNAGGYYDGWTEHKVTVTPSFSGFEIAISGRDRNEIKDYLSDVFYNALSDEIECFADGRIVSTWQRKFAVRDAQIDSLT